MFAGSHATWTDGVGRLVDVSARCEPGEQSGAAEAPLLADAAARQGARVGECEHFVLADLQERGGLRGGQDLEAGLRAERVVAQGERAPERLATAHLAEALEAGGAVGVDVLGDERRDEILLRGAERVRRPAQATGLLGGEADVQGGLRRERHIRRISHMRGRMRAGDPTGAAATVRLVVTTIEELELDLEVFTGPFDLLLTLVLREDVDLLEVELADVVVSYLDVLEARGELDLDVATEFLVLIAALLELKSRLMLPREQEEPFEELAPGEAAEELLARMLEARRYRRVADHLRERLAGEHGYRYRAAPPPAFLKALVLPDAEAAAAVYDPAQLGAAVGGLLRRPEPIALDHLTFVRVTVAERLEHLRALLRRGGCTFTEAVADADRVTVAVTLFGLLELYKQGEATWTQEGTFAEIHIAPVVPRAALVGIGT